MSPRAPVIAAVLAALIAAAAFLFLVFPTFGELEEVETAFDRAQAETTALEIELEQLESVAEQLPRIQRQLARFRRRVPPVADLPGLINQLQTAADVSRVDFVAIAPGEPAAAPTGRVAEIPAQIQVIGGFFPVDEFLFRLETLPRATKVTNISVSEGPDGLPQIDVQLQTAFYTTDLAAGPGASAGEPAGTSPVAPAPASPAPGATPVSPAPGVTPAETPTPGG